MVFNYALLKEKIRDEYKTAGNFAAAMGISNARLSLMLNGKGIWTSEMIYKAASLLGITDSIEEFFFTPKFDKPNRGK